MQMDPRFVVNTLLKLPHKSGDESNAIRFAVCAIQRFCYPAEPLILQVGKSKKYYCRRCNQPLRASDCFGSVCGQRIFQQIKVVNG